jgi:hypothetical protein
MVCPYRQNNLEILVVQTLVFAYERGTAIAVCDLLRLMGLTLMEYFRIKPWQNH